MRNDTDGEPFGARQIGIGLRVHGFRLVDLIASLGDRGVCARERGVVLGQQRVELAAVKPRQDLILLDPVAVFGQQLDDAQPVNLRTYHCLVACNQRSRYEQVLHEFAFACRQHGHGRRQRFCVFHRLARWRRCAQQEHAGAGCDGDPGHAQHQITLHVTSPPPQAESARASPP